MQISQAEKDDVVRQGKSHLYKPIPLGRPGDTFAVDGRQFEIVDVSERALKVIASSHYRMDGYDSPDDFIKSWKANHSLHDPELRLYVHWFRKIDTSCPDD